MPGDGRPLVIASSAHVELTLHRLSLKYVLVNLLIPVDHRVDGKALLDALPTGAAVDFPQPLNGVGGRRWYY